MATLIYSPAIKVHVETDKLGILDISEDITSWEVTRRSNAVSSFNFTLQNPQRKYDGKFRPSDRITVQLKRITWVRVFTGSLNNSPIFSAWPRELPMSASCTMKKPQFWPWNPATTPSVNMITKYISNLNADSAAGDGGLSKLITESMVQVMGWDPKAIHIGAVPNAWFKWAQRIENDIDAAASMASVLGPSATIGGVQQYSDLKLKAGKFGPYSLTQPEVDNAIQIYSIIAGQGGLSSQKDQDLAAQLAIATAGSYSSLDATRPGGLFGFQSNWGSTTETSDLRWSSIAFLKGGNGKGTYGLLDKKKWRTQDPETLCRSIQGSYSMVNFDKWYQVAEHLVTALRGQLTSQLASGTASAGSGVWGGTAPPTGHSNYKATGDTLAKVAYDLVTSRKDDPIVYSEERGTKACDPRNSHPTRLDCSSFVSWVYYHSTGEIWSGTNTYTMYPQCKIIPLKIAGDIRGALGFASGSNPGHVGMSLGNGGWEAAAHMAYSDPHQDVRVDKGGLFTDGLSQGALIPGIDYSSSATSEEARAYLQKTLGIKCSLASGAGPSDISATNPSLTGAAPGTATESDPFGQLVSALVAAPTINGDIFGGARQLINNQPFLPWLGNLTNSSMRAWCSAPNGDFIAWFPDYFNVWETAAIMKIKPIELMDFTVDWSDQQIVTHEFVIGSVPTMLDTASGTISGGQDYAGAAAMLNTQGIATMDFPQIFEAIYGKAASAKFVHDYLTRFGARPNLEQFPNLFIGPQEFYMALWMFMKHWSEQFNAVVPMTFMPELWPGMIIQIDEFGFQAYVTEVTHQGSYGQGGQFTTNATIIAPAPIDKKLRGSLFGVLDI